MGACSDDTNVVATTRDGGADMGGSNVGGASSCIERPAGDANTQGLCSNACFSG